MKCSSCGSELKIIEYQARSADEAQRSISRCPNCPLNIDEFEKSRASVHVHLNRKKREFQYTPTIDSSCAETIRYVYAKTKISNLGIQGKRYPVYATNYIDQYGKMFRHHHNGIWSNKGVCITSISSIAPNIKLVTMKMLHMTDMSSTHYKLHDCIRNADTDYIVDSMDISEWYRIDTDENILQAVELLYTLGFAPLKLSDCISQTTLGSLSNLTARAYDKYSVPDNEYMFSDKPDGERMWVTKIGAVCIFSTRLMNHTVRGWKIDTMYSIDSEYQTGPVVDVEFLFGFNPKLIDVLMDSNGKIVTQQRTIESINTMFDRIQTLFPIYNMIDVRPFFNTFQEASKYRNTLSYPTDGIVAISNSGTDMFKIKDERSMELELMENGALCTSDNTVLFSSDCNTTYDPGTIIEVRFSIVNGQIDVKNLFHRSDKQKANDMKAVSNIIESSMVPTDDSNNIVRTEIWRWSNRLRSELYSSVKRRIKNRGVILDIGTGDGQSLDSIMNIDNLSFIFVEPDTEKCRKLISKLRLRTYHTDPRSLIPSIPQLRKGILRYHVLNCSLNKIVEDQPTMKNLVSVVDFATSIFSAQYVIRDLEKLSLRGVEILGCCYLYDNIDSDMSIIDSYGIQMKRLTRDTAQIKWGTDKIYNEPAWETEDLSESFMCIRATDLTGPPSDIYDGLIKTVCSHIWILRSR